MDKSNLLIIVASVSVFISVLLAVFLLTVKTKNRVSNVLFAVFLIINAIDISDPLFNMVSDGPSNLGVFKNMFVFLQIPVFYLYVLSVCYSEINIFPLDIWKTTALKRWWMRKKRKSCTIFTTVLKILVLKVSDGWKAISDISIIKVLLLRNSVLQP